MAPLWNVVASSDNQMHTYVEVVSSKKSRLCLAAVPRISQCVWAKCRWSGLYACAVDAILLCKAREQCLVSKQTPHLNKVDTPHFANRIRHRGSMGLFHVVEKLRRGKDLTHLALAIIQTASPAMCWPCMTLCTLSAACAIDMTEFMHLPTASYGLHMRQMGANEAF